MPPSFHDFFPKLELETGLTYQVAVLLRRDPDVAVAPFAQVAEFLDFGMVVLDVVFDGEAAGVVDTDVAAEAPENSAGFVGCEAGERARGSELASNSDTSFLLFSSFISQIFLYSLCISQSFPHLSCNLIFHLTQTYEDGK